jgi:hypothetical protein
MPRKFRKFFLLLLAGAAINVLVAWSLAVLVDPFKTQLDFTQVRTALKNLRGPQNQGLGQMTVTSHGGFGTRRIILSCNCAPPPWGPGPDGSLEQQQNGDIAALVPTWCDLDQPSFEYLAGKLNFERRVLDARGWPMPCMWHMAGHLTMIDTQSGIQEGQTIGGIALSPPLPMWRDPTAYSSQPDEPRTLPLRIIPSGFAINTIFYGLAVYLAIMIPGATRRLMRRRRGQCADCGYLVGNSSVCTECGAAVSLRVVPFH